MERTLTSLNEFYKEWKYVIVAMLSVVVLSIFLRIGHKIYEQRNIRAHMEISLQKANESIVEPIARYTSSAYGKTSGGLLKQSEDSFSTEQQYTANTAQEAYIEGGALFQEQSAAFTRQYTVSDANKELFNLADRYYEVYYGNQRVSPIYPLAVANVETPGRADHSKTWSALFPSKYADVSELYTFDVTSVLSNKTVYAALSSEWSTRDRGALQMSPTYGTKGDYFVAQMSGSEKEKLSRIDTSGYETWVSGAKTAPGDRFYIPDVCLSLAAANTQAVDYMQKNSYTPKTDLMLIAQLAMFHHRSGIWYNKDHSKSVAEWYSASKAYEFAELCSSTEMTEALRVYAATHEDTFCLTNEEAKKLFQKTTGRQFTEFASKDLVMLYPVKILYAYIKLCIMYQS